jgi:hypothetical protein
MMNSISFKLVAFALATNAVSPELCASSQILTDGERAELGDLCGVCLQCWGSGSNVVINTTRLNAEVVAPYWKEIDSIIEQIWLRYLEIDEPIQDEEMKRTIVIRSVEEKLSQAKETKDPVALQRLVDTLCNATNWEARPKKARTAARLLKLRILYNNQRDPQKIIEELTIGIDVIEKEGSTLFTSYVPLLKNTRRRLQELPGRNFEGFDEEERTEITPTLLERFAALFHIH